MAVYRIDPLIDERWKHFVDQHPSATIFHSCGWLQSLRQTYRYEPIVFTTCTPNQALTNGVVFCAVKSWITGSRLVSLPFSDHCEPLVDGPEALREILGEVMQQLESRGWDHIEIRPLFSKYEAALAETGFSPATTFHLHLLHLRPRIDDLFRAFDKDSVQRKIRRAQREGLSYQEGRSAELLATFHRLLVMTRRRHHVPPQPISWFRNLAQTLGEALKIRVASVKGRAVASIISLCHNGTMVYKYGCSDLRYSNLGGTALLFWSMIQDAKASDCHTLDLGRSDNDNPGLLRFKANWGASDSALTYWRYPAPAQANKKFESKRRNVVRQIISRLPNRIFVTLGELMYRHMG